MSGLDGIHSTQRDAGELILDPGWSVDGTMFGGALLRDAAVHASARLELEGWTPIALSARFLRAVPPGPTRVDVELLHRGRTSCVAEVRMMVGHRVAALHLITWAPDDEVQDAPLSRSRVRGEPEPLASAHSASGVERRVDWRVDGDWGPADGILTSWIADRDGTGAASIGFCAVAADLLVPALPGARRDHPIRIASLALDVTVLARPASRWLRQETTATRHGPLAEASMVLSGPDGSAVARSLHRARLLPAQPHEMPYCATAFGAGVDSTPGVQTSGLS